jgi:1-acyl-sn-glycerol-3-phosphate acyltransferase
VWSIIRSIYAWLLLSVIMLPLFPATWIFARITHRSDPKRDRLRVLVASWVSLYARLTPLYGFHVENRERLPATGAFVLIANHESGLDVLSLLYLRTRARFLAERWIFKVPLAGALMRACRHIPVKPGDKESGRSALEEVGRALGEGSPVAIFPEGELSPDGMTQFRAGAFVAAKRAGVPIVPLLLEGTGAAWRPGTLVVRGRHEIRIAVLPAITAEQVASQSPEVLADQARAAILAARRIAQP